MFPTIPHEATGALCSGSIVVTVHANDAELCCNKCGAVVGVVNTAFLAELLALIPADPRH
jgi:hypothetical protein